ncbi:MAG TPA: hypothetical protein VFQ91_25005 [Bryobacteraceae bacterium]|nr:hypothetical protein [Bryobacteraceae bacterium]
MTNLHMKQLVLWLACLGISPAAEFYSGQAARLLIGQKTFTASDPIPGVTTLGGVGGLAIANNMLFVSDSNRVSSSPLNHRVLIYRNLDQITLPVNAPIPQNSSRCPACRGIPDNVIGQTDFVKNELPDTPSAASLRNPTGVATDGTRVAVADTNNNRVLIWNSVPTSNRQAADIVLGQPDFTTVAAQRGAPGQRMRGPQGVWIQGNQLFVADTNHNRVLIWNSFPTSNYQAADVVIGQPDFNSDAELDPSRISLEAKDNNLVNPVSVTSDGQRLIVSDLGQNRVLVWNSIPTSNGKAADLVLGQKDFAGNLSNNSSKLCPSSGIGDDGTPVYPFACMATMDFPRYALSDGTRLFIADGGNDRVLVYNTFPTENGQAADVVLGQLNGNSNRTSDSAYPLFLAGADLLRTPVSLAWDGTNLFVSDTFNRRIVVFSRHDQPLPYTAVRNLASRDVFATASIIFDGTIKEGDEVTLTISGKDYKYKFIRDDTFANILLQFAQQINADSASTVTASVIPDLKALLLTARQGGEDGNSIDFTTAKSPDTSTIALTTSGATLAGGQNAALLAAGTLVTIYGENLAESTVSVPEDTKILPRTLGGVHVYFDGIESPISMVSPTQINAQIPWEVADATSANAYVRTEHSNGPATTSSPVSVTVIKQNPGIFAKDGTDPRTGIITHFSDRATGTISVDGSIAADDVATVVIEDREYAYTVKAEDTLATVRDALIALINANEEEKVEAYSAGVFTRIRLRSKITGADGNGLVYSAKTNDGAQVILTATTPALCCANTAGSLITEENPALPGETIVVTATGLGALKDADTQALVRTGIAFDGTPANEPAEFVSSLAGGKTANVLYAALKPGFIGLYEVHLELNSDLPTNSQTQVTIAQDIYVSNVVTFALKNPADEEETENP